VDDYLSESEQWEQLKIWLRANLPWIVGGLAVGAAGLAGWRWYDARQESQKLEASVKYEQTLEAFDKGDRTKAITLIGELERDYEKSPYVDQAHLAEARVSVQNGQLDKAAQGLKSVMEQTRDPPLALIARLRLARVQLALNKPDEALATLDAEKELGAFGPRYSEARGDIHLAKGDAAAALKDYRAAREGNESGTIDTELLDLKINELADRAQPEK
jgi:predicted negative regulator of RcsB-dependent stress response